MDAPIHLIFIYSWTKQRRAKLRPFWSLICATGLRHHIQFHLLLLHHTYTHNNWLNKFFFLFQIQFLALSKIVEHFQYNCHINVRGYILILDADNRFLFYFSLFYWLHIPIIRPLYIRIYLSHIFLILVWVLYLTLSTHNNQNWTRTTSMIFWFVFLTSNVFCWQC